jgi:hypothetical protein
MPFDCTALLPGHNGPFAQGARAVMETEHSTMSFVKQRLAIAQSSGSIEIIGDMCRCVPHMIVAELCCDHLDLSWRCKLYSIYRNIAGGDLELSSPCFAPEISQMVSRNKPGDIPMQLLDEI